MSYPPCRYAHRWPELWAQLPTDADRRRLSQNLASGRLDGQEPSRAFVAAFLDRMLGRITREEFLAGDHHLPPCTRTDYQPSHHPTPATPPTSPTTAITSREQTGRHGGDRTIGQVRRSMLPWHRCALALITFGCPRVRHAGR